MEKLLNRPILTQKFITEFKCIGEQCEDDCCHGWGIPIEKKAYIEIERLYQDINGGKNLISKALKRNKEAEDDRSYGQLIIEAGKPCPFLNSNGLCDIQARFGHQKLGWPCKDYPRLMSNNFDQIELYISLSCPEAARLCLLKPDSTTLVETSNNILNNTSGFIGVLPKHDESKPYFQLRNEIRQIMLLLADAKQYDTNSRLYLMLHFADRIGAFFHNDTTSFSMEKLYTEIDHIADPSIHSKVVSEFSTLPYDPTLSISVIHALLTFRADHSSGFNDYVLTCVDRHHELGTSGLANASHEILIKTVQSYLERKENIELSHRESINSYFDNYICYYWFKHWYFVSPTLISHVRKLLVHINIIKFLFFLNPLLDPLLEPTKKTDQETAKKQKQLLDQAIVQTCYQCARGFEHISPEFLNIVSQALDDQGIVDLKQLAMLAKS
jgi:lysine-N-methylase